MVDGARFRAGVGLLVVNPDGLVLAAERAEIPDAWQTPQGGMTSDEDPVDAARRELREETGITWDQITLLEEHPLWLGYELPAEARSRRTGRGQVHRWFLLRYGGPDDAIDLSSASSASSEAEFTRWQWLSLQRLIDLAWAPRQPVYEQLRRDWARHLEL